MKRRIRSVAAAGALLIAPAAAEAAEIGRIRVHLVYEETGRLSDDVSGWPQMGPWNTYSGGGPAEENANDLLVLVEVIAGPEDRAGVPEGVDVVIDQPLEIRATDGEGHLIARRRFADSLLTGDDGRVWKALWLPQSTCAGRIRITASIGRSTREAAVTLNCGE